MRIGIYCEYQSETANGILMRGRAEALARLGHRVKLIYHPYKFNMTPAPARHRIGLQARLSVRTIRSYVFSAKGIMRILGIPLLVFWDFPRVLQTLWFNDLVILHKAMPPSLAMLCALKATFFRGETMCILDDWEGVGGFASIRSANSVWRKLLVTLAEELTPELTDYVQCVSRILCKRLDLSEKTRYKYVYLPNGGPPIEAKRESATTKVKDGSPLRIGYVGTFKSNWLVSFLAEIVQETAALVPSAEFVFVGGGPLLEKLQDACKRCAKNCSIEFTGQIPRQDVDKQVASFDVCCLVLNSAYPESFIDAGRSSVKMFEYMSHGKIIVAPNFAEPANILVNNETGLLVENRPKAFAEAFKRIAQDKQEHDKMGKRAQETFECNYKHDILMARLLDWIASQKKGIR